MCVGVGGAIGSGIFATPGEAAKHIDSPWTILLLWLVVGGITLTQSLVTAELATRFPKAGGEYQYLKEAYGNFAAFFFGWSFSVFIVGAGAGTIAAALGEFAAELFKLKQASAAPMLGCAAVIGVATVNAMGLRAGAWAQNTLTILKAGALLSIAVSVCIVAGRVTPAATETAREATGTPIHAFFLALLPVFWSYTGATDSAKLAEEVQDVHKALPRALAATALTLTAIYFLYNYALFCAVAPADMADKRSVPALALASVESWPVGQVILGVSILICLGSISSIFLANVRVMYALARDGLTFSALAFMSQRQAPMVSLAVAAAIACTFVANRSFGQILHIYFMASTVLFSLTYVSLLVFRRRDRLANRPFPSTAYKAPAGPLLVAMLLVLELGIAVSIVSADVQTWLDPNVTNSWDSLLTLGLLAGLAMLYGVWRAVKS